MSHQDPLLKASSSTHAADLYEVFRWLTPAKCFAGIEFRRDCHWSPRILAFAALLWSWSDQPKLGGRFHRSLQIIRGLFKKQHVPEVSYQAFMKLLRRWSDPLLARLQSAYRDKMQTSPHLKRMIEKWRVFAVDGSKVSVPRTRKNEERFSPKSKLSRQAQARRRKRRKKRLIKRAREEHANVPQILLTMVWHVASGLPWAWQVGPSDSSERNHLRDMLAMLPQGALLTADAGFVGYDLWSNVLANQLHWLIRVGRNVRLLKNLGYVKHDQDCVYLWPNKAAKKHLPPLVLRLIVCDTGRYPIYLVTNLDAQQLSDVESQKIYRQRWQIELFYRHYKQTFDRAKLRSKNPDNALLELEWSLMGIWAMGIYSHVQLGREGVPPAKVSFAGVLHAFRHAMSEHRLRPMIGESLRELIALAIIDDYVRKNKANRDYPQKKQHQPPGPPILVKATPNQKLKARRHNELEKRRLTA